MVSFLLEVYLLVQGASYIQNAPCHLHDISLMKDGSYEFGISESHSGLFHLEGLSQKKIPAAKHLQIICPHHCQHELEAINHNTLICSQCDPRLANIEGGM